MASPNNGMHTTEEESYFVSMTDLMVGMLFIFIIMLMAFALNLREQEEKFDQTTSALTQANETRREMLEDIKNQMERLGVKVIIDPENGVLRLPEELLFPRGEFQLTEKGREALKRLAEVMTKVLPCYANAPTKILSSCLPSRGGRLEAVFIEGHTDDHPIVSRMNNGIKSNWDLSAARAIKTFNALVQHAPSLALVDNDSRQRILGVSGYAENRPVRKENNEEARAANRRIDLRFLMATPNTEELSRIKESVKEGVMRR
ncbi:OmpA/MotB family protein [Methylocaldum sp.]|uniref:OmpA/MotB family protein n=1 Tax=Methylocaldum sp. TaxID=1969727 RepID=UPI002D3EEC8E|nr:OmpA family protein [Methylocaldum sp.]HYE36945.1 OmpA family protein [Methylocaldum sp.]